MALKLSSSAFAANGEIPKTYSGEGEERTPPLEWSRVPPGTQEFALLCEDPDAPGNEPWVHWVLYGISANTTLLPEGLPSKPALELPIRLSQGRNTNDLIGYQGPMPPRGHGWHRYFFHLYALDRKVTLAPGAHKDELLREIQGHILDEAVLIGRYLRTVSKAA
ncbi:MAG: YbhB/YbcL family Raf kinase inhibitor-like protein [Oligoflexia bacterium]|nr:YbhB/YbcL family Raf kinase inhibitor-like protein [Oligoflexia bacterium]